MGGLCAAAYFLYLTVLVCQALWQIFTKRRLLPALQADQRVYYSGLIYRFTALLIYTILCAALTVIFYIFSQVDFLVYFNHPIFICCQHPSPTVIISTRNPLVTSQIIYWPRRIRRFVHKIDLNQQSISCGSRSTCDSLVNSFFSRKVVSLVGSH